MIKRAGILLVGILLAGCATGTTPAGVTPVPVPSSSVGLPASAPAPTAAASVSAPSPSGSGGGGTVDPAAFLQLCARWPDDVDGEPIPCDELVRAALEADPGGDPVTRIETSYTCATSCRPIDPDRGFAMVVTETGAVEVEVARGADGTIAVAATAPIDPPDPPSFDAPPASAPAIDGAPAEVNGRTPVALCGHEVAEPFGPLDADARECFWNGVRAGSPVEFISSSADTEGRPTTTVYRYAGTGGVEIVYNDEAGWFRMSSGLEPAPDGPVFDLAGLTTAPTAIPEG